MPLRLPARFQKRTIAEAQPVRKEAKLSKLTKKQIRGEDDRDLAISTRFTSGGMAGKFSTRGFEGLARLSKLRKRKGLPKRSLEAEAKVAKSLQPDAPLGRGLKLENAIRKTKTNDPDTTLNPIARKAKNLVNRDSIKKLVVGMDKRQFIRMMSKQARDPVEFNPGMKPGPGGLDLRVGSRGLIMPRGEPVSEAIPRLTKSMAKDKPIATREKAAKEILRMNPESRELLSKGTIKQGKKDRFNKRKKDFFINVGRRKSASR